MKMARAAAATSADRAEDPETGRGDGPPGTIRSGRRGRLPGKLVTFEGPDAQVVYYKDFLFPENATDIQTADLMVRISTT
jgi:hypothetical protein